ncbi:MAG: hypothetical protein ACK5M7_09170 [Draconibacterium sp.]
MYKGSKNGNGTYQTIINQIPPHEVYSEWFAGSAAIYFNKLAANTTILCDKIRCGHRIFLSIITLLEELAKLKYRYIVDVEKLLGLLLIVLPFWHYTPINPEYQQ